MSYSYGRGWEKKGERKKKEKGKERKTGKEEKKQNNGIYFIPKINLGGGVCKKKGNENNDSTHKGEKN